jgi:hypothetical protein
MQTQKPTLKHSPLKEEKGRHPLLLKLEKTKHPKTNLQSTEKEQKLLPT